MAASNFERSLAAVLEHEGGYVDHPADPGGATNMGITQKTLADWRGRAVTKDEVRALTVAEAGAIYRARYWDAIRGDELPIGVDLAVFDFAVNSGVSRASKYLQSLVGVTQDGLIGSATLMAVRETDAINLIERLCNRRMDFLRGLDTFDTFGKGWTRRVDAVRSLALVMAMGPKPVDRPADKPLKPLGPKVEKPTPSQKPASPGHVPDPGGNLRFILIGAVGLIVLAILFVAYNTLIS